MVVEIAPLDTLFALPLVSGTIVAFDTMLDVSGCRLTALRDAGAWTIKQPTPRDEADLTLDLL